MDHTGGAQQLSHSLSLLLTHMRSGRQPHHTGAHRQRRVRHGAQHRLVRPQGSFHHVKGDCGGHRDDDGLGPHRVSDLVAQLNDLVGLDSEEHHIGLGHGFHVGRLVILLGQHANAVLIRTLLRRSRGARGRHHILRCHTPTEEAGEDRSVHRSQPHHRDLGHQLCSCPKCFRAKASDSASMRSRSPTLRAVRVDTSTATTPSNPLPPKSGWAISSIVSTTR